MMFIFNDFQSATDFDCLILIPFIFFHRITIFTYTYISTYGKIFFVPDNYKILFYYRLVIKMEEHLGLFRFSPDHPGLDEMQPPPSVCSRHCNVNVKPILLLRHPTD